jgi:soluble lytic murein transglycosylase
MQPPAQWAVRRTGVDFMDIRVRRFATCATFIALIGLSATPSRAVIDDVAFGRLSLDDLVGPRETVASAPTLNLTALKQAIDLYRRGDVAGGDRLRSELKDPAARALMEWVAIRSNGTLGFERIADFLREDARWPSGALIRRRAEEALLQSRKPAAVVRAFFATQRPLTTAGKYALAVAFRADGLDKDAAALIRDAWREDALSREFETKILDNFPGVVTQADHRFRMERFLFKENWTAALRAAEFAGKDYAALVKARQAVAGKSSKAQAALDAVPQALRSDTSFVFSKAQHLRRAEKVVEAAKLIEGVTRDPEVLADGDEWWTERRLIARKLLDEGDPKTAYEVVRNHGAESNAQKIEAEFHAGWIALRFLHDATGATIHFGAAASYAGTPISLARVAYWQGRAAEAAGNEEEARIHFERAATHPIAYYGQLARARLGHETIELRTPPDTEAGRESFKRLTAAQALPLLYRIGAPELALPLYVDLAQRLAEPGQLDALGDLAADHDDPRGLLTVGKLAVQRGFPLDAHAYPTIGIPSFQPVGGRVDKAMVYAIARQESAFHPRAQSHAGARGLMQLMPATAKRTAKRFGVDFKLERLLDDPAYNAKLGSAHLGELMEDWRGSLILTFASYNAGGGNVKKWIDAYGDPRSSYVDPIDWIERIPFSETRNYVQRVMENLQVYRHRLEDRSILINESGLRRGAVLR